MRGVSSGGLDDGWFRGLAGKRLLDGFSGCGWLPVLFWVGGLLSLRGLGSVWPLALSGLGWWGGGVVGCVLSREVDTRAPRHPRFILLGSFIDPLLVVSILEIVYDCHL